MNFEERKKQIINHLADIKPSGLSDVDGGNILRYLLGGALTGGGLAAAYNYYKDYSELEDEVDAQEKEEMESNNSRKMVNLGKVASLHKEAEYEYQYGNSAADKLLRWTATGAGLAGGYFGIKEIYDRIKEKKLNEELEVAQEEYLNTLHAKREQERNKYASLDKSAEVLGTSMAGMGSILLALAIASGVITNKSLDDAFPGVKPTGKKDDLGGRPISLKKRRSDPMANESPSDKTVLDENGEEIKTVSSDKSSDARDDAEEVGNLIRVTTADKEVEKNAGFDDLIHAVALGRTEEIKESIPYGIDQVFDIIKGAGMEKISAFERELAIEVLASEPMLKEAFTPLFAAEYNEMSPYIVEASRNIKESSKEAFLKLARDFNAEYRKCVFESSDILKSAYEGLDKSAFVAVPKGLSEVFSKGHGFHSSGDEPDYDSEESQVDSDKEDPVEEEPDDQPDMIDEILS